MKYWTVIIGLFLSLSVYAQLPSNRIKPGIMYHAGDTVRLPRIGLSTRIPEGWSGVLPRDTEVFLLMPENNSVGEIYVVLNEKADLQVQRKLWESGMDLAEGLRLQRDGEISTRGTDVIGTMAKLVGNSANNQAKIYLEAKCSPNGFCVSYVSTSDAVSFENVKKALQQFVDNTVFSKPSNESPYKNFDWKKFLSGKILLSFGYENNSKREDQVNLCEDGTFHSTLTRTGIFKDQAKGYQGKKRGKWDVRSNGERATLTFTFDKVPPVDVEIEAREEEVYVKGIRYFVGESEGCE
jgi:hypothetical protein